MTPGHPYLVWPPQVGLTSLNTKQLSSYTIDFALFYVYVTILLGYLSTFQWVPLALPNPLHGSLLFSYRLFFSVLWAFLCIPSSTTFIPSFSSVKVLASCHAHHSIFQNKNPQTLPTAKKANKQKPEPLKTGIWEYSLILTPLSMKPPLCSCSILRMWLVLIPEHAASSPSMSVPLFFPEDVLSFLQTP